MANGNGQQNDNQQSPQPDEPNRLRKFYEGIQPVMDNLPEYGEFRDKLTGSRARRKTLYEDLSASGEVEDLPDNFQTFERKLFQVEEPPEGQQRSVDRQQQFEPGADPLDALMGFGRRQNGDRGPARTEEGEVVGEEGFDTRFNIRRNQKIRALENEVDQKSIAYEEARSEANESTVEVGGYPNPVKIPDPQLQNKAKRIKQERDDAATRLERVRQTIRDEQDTGQSAASSAFSSFMQGAVRPLSERILKSASNTLTLMSPPGMRQMRQATQTSQPLYEAGEQVGQMIQETFPENPKYQEDFLIKTLPTAAGFAVSTLAGGSVARAATLPSQFGGAIVGSAALASQEFENALDRTGDPDKAFQTFVYNLPVGATEGILPGRFFSRLNKGTGGAAAKTLEQWVKTEGKSLAKKSATDKAKTIGADFLKGGTEEFFQETTQNWLTNLGAQNIYDETRGLFDNLLEEGAAGFIIGSFLNGAGRAINVAKQDAEGRRLEEVQKAEEFINEQQRRFASGQIPRTGQAEQQAGQRQLQTQIDFSFDPTAPLEQQVQKLRSERAKLNDQASELESDDPSQADYGVAIAQIDDLIQKKQAEIEGEQAPESEQQAEEPAGEEAGEGQQAGEDTASAPDEGADQVTLPEETQTLINDIDSTENPAEAAEQRRDEVVDAAEQLGIESPSQRETGELMQDLRERARQSQSQPEEEPSPEGTGQQTPYPNVSEDAQQFLEDFDETGIMPTEITGDLQQMAEENDIEVAEQSNPGELIDRLRQKGAGLEAPPVGRPVAESNLNTADNVPYQGGLAIASRNRQTGEVHVGGTSHADLINQFENDIDTGQSEMGFFTEDGQFLTRNEATWWKKRQVAGEDISGQQSSDPLFAEDLIEEATDRPADQVQPGMQVQWNRQGQAQFDSPRRVREVETDANTGRRYVRVDGEPRWLPEEQMEIADPEPTQSQEELEAQIQYASEISDLGTELASNNYDEASAAAETATAMALDNGVESYPEFYAMTAEAIDGKPNPQALRNGWERALGEPANQNKLDINRGEGTLSGRYNDWTSWLSYQFMLQMYNENHPVSVMEKRLAEQYNEADRFDYDNIDSSVDTFMKLMPGRMSAIWDKYLNPRRRYSEMGQIIREAVSRDIQMSDFTQMGDLYEQLAEAKREGHTTTARELEQQIEEIAKSDELQQFLIAKHAIESNEFAQEKFADEIEALNEQIAELEPEVENMRGQRREAAQDRVDELKRQRDARRYPLDMTTQEAQQVLNEFRRQDGTSADTKYDDLMAVGEKIWALENQYLEEAVDIGVITTDSRDRMLDTYEFHIPANRIITDEYGNVTGGIIPAMMDGSPKIYERQGSDRMIGHILTNITHNFDKMMRYGMKNQARIKTADIMREEMARGNTSLGQVVSESELSPTDADMSVPFREVQQREVPQEDGSTQTERIIQEKHLVFSDPEMFEMFAELNASPTGTGAWHAIVKGIMNLQHFTIIGASLSFGPSNQFRDITDAMQNALSELDTEVASIPKEMLMGNNMQEISNWKDFVKNRVMPYHRAIVHFERTGGTDSQQAQDYQRLKELGGTTTFYRVLSQDRMMDDLTQTSREIQDIAEKKPSLNTAKSMARKVGNGIDYWNNMWENSLRTVLFRVGLDSGMSETKAAEFALETMPNFNRIGKVGRRINNNFLFFNASVAAMASHGFAWRGGAAKVATASAGIAMSSYLNALMNDSFSDDDEYEKDKRVNTWKYHKNVVMNQFNEDGNINQFRIPIGYSSSVYWGIGGDMYDLQQGYIDEDEFQKRLATNLADVYNPMSGADMFEDTQHGIYAMTPTWAKPIGSMATNVVFGGRLYSDFKLAQPTVDDWQLYSPYTPKTFRYASEWLNKNDIADVSPKTLNLWWEWSTNSAGKDVGGFKEFYDAFVDGEDFDADQLPVLRRFYRSMNQAEVNYRSIWDRISRYNDDAPMAGTQEMETLLDNIEQEYGAVEGSDTMPEYQMESLDSGIQTYVDFLRDQRYKQEAAEYFDSRGWKGGPNEDAHREDRYRYYKRENYKANEFGSVRYKWENGRFVKEISNRRAYTMDVIKDIEGKYKTPGEDITFSTD